MNTKQNNKLQERRDLRISIQVTADEYNRVLEAAQSDDRTMSDWGRRALKRELADHSGRAGGAR